MTRDVIATKVHNMVNVKILLFYGKNLKPSDRNVMHLSMFCPTAMNTGKDGKVVGFEHLNVLIPTTWGSCIPWNNGISNFLITVFHYRGLYYISTVTLIRLIKWSQSSMVYTWW